MHFLTLCVVVVIGIFNSDKEPSLVFCGYFILPIGLLLELLFSQFFLSFSSLLLPSLTLFGCHMWDLSYPTRNRTCVASSGTWNPNYCTATEVPSYLNELSFQLCFMLLSCIFHFLLNRDEEARKELWGQSFFLARSVVFLPILTPTHIYVRPSKT